MINLYNHQSEALKVTADKNRVAYYHDMGLGKTFTGSEKMIKLGAKVNLVICQKSKVEDWVDHFVENYELSKNMMIYNCTKWDKSDWLLFSFNPDFSKDAHQQDVTVLLINYELAFRRPELSQLSNFTLMLDESSLIQNETAKRSKFILKKLQPANVILLSGTPTGGKYEKLWSQMRLLGWNISKDTYWNSYIDYHYEDYGGFPRKVIDGYKNVERLKRKMREYGCHFLKTNEVIDLPAQIFTTVKVPASKWYQKFRKDKVVNFNYELLVNNACDPNDVGYRELIGDSTLTAMLYERELCAQYSEAKLEAFDDLIDSTNDRLIVFYNFTEELELLSEIDRPVSIVNGKTKDLKAYEECSDSVTFIQYQAGAMGLNLQLANKIVYFSPPLSSELYEQSKKRINRIGQSRTCYYYNLVVRGSIEERIYKTLEMRKDFTDKLFMEGDT